LKTQRQNGWETPIQYERAVSVTKHDCENPPNRSLLRVSRKSSEISDCVVGLRGLKLRARLAVVSNQSLERANKAGEMENFLSPFIVVKDPGAWLEIWPDR
jgi:hypothetical protein